VVRLDLVEQFFLLLELNANWQASFVTNNFFFGREKSFLPLITVKAMANSSQNRLCISRHGELVSCLIDLIN
jgi:hypothetical protein